MTSFFKLTAVLWAACFFLPPAPAFCQDWKFGSSFNYDTGKYGTDDLTDTVYIPFTLKRYFDDWDLSATVSWLRQSSAGQVTNVGGSPVRADRTAVTSTVSSSESGPGDIILKGGYALKEDGPGSFDLALAGKLKLPTADEEKGLGTGETDWGGGLEFAKEISRDWTFLADAYYAFIGDPPGIDYDNRVSFDTGFSLMLDKGLSLTALYEDGGAILRGTPSARDLSGTVSYAPAAGRQFFGGLLLGLSDGSPDMGISAGFSQKF